MRRLLLCGFSVLFIYSMYCQDNRSLLLDDLYSCLIDDDIILWGEIPDTLSVFEKDAYLGGKYILRIMLKNDQEIKDTQPNLLSEPIRRLMKTNQEITGESLLSLFTENKAFVLLNYSPMSTVGISYRQILLNDNLVGEECFRVSQDGLLAPTGYSFRASLITDDGLIDFSLMYYDPETFSVAKSMNKYFIMKENNLFWRSHESIELFYNDIVSNSNDIHPSVNKLYKMWRDLIQSLKEIK